MKKLCTILLISVAMVANSQVTQKSFDSLKAVINDMKGQSISFDNALPVTAAGKVTNAASLPFIDSVRKNKFTPVNPTTPAFADSIRKGLFAGAVTPGTLAFMDSVRKGLFAGAVTPGTLAFMDSARKTMQVAAKLTLEVAGLTASISGYSDKFKSLDVIDLNYKGRIETLEGSLNTLNGRLIDSTASLRKSITNLNSIMYGSYTKRLDSLSTAVQAQTLLLTGYQGELKTIKEGIATLKVDVDACKVYDGILEKTIFVLPKKP